MEINVEEDLLDSNRKNTIEIDEEINDFIDNDGSQNIKADIELLNNMGFDRKMINKVL